MASGTPEADPGGGLRGSPPLGSFETCLATDVYPLFIPNIISLQEGCSYSSSWLLNHPNARSIFDEDRHARHLFCIVPSIIALQLDDEVEGMMFWEKDIPFSKSFENEVSKWKRSDSQQIGSFHLLLAMKMLSQTSIVFCSLPAPYWSQAQKLSDRFHWWNESRPALGPWQCLKSDSLISQTDSDRHALLRKIWGRGRRDMPGSFCKGSSKKALSSWSVWLNRRVKKETNNYPCCTVTGLVLWWYSVSHLTN